MATQIPRSELERMATMCLHTFRRLEQAEGTLPPTERALRDLCYQVIGARPQHEFEIANKS